MIPVKIDRAKPEDAAIICDIRDRAWVQTYTNTERGISAEQILLNAQGSDGVFLPRRIAYMQRVLADNIDKDVTTYVAKNNNQIVAYIEPLIDEDAKQWISAVYVAPEYQGNGIGGQLMEQALSVLDRSKDIFLEVVSYNQNAITFYESFGFIKTDAVVLPDERAPDYVVALPEIEMVLPANA